MSRPNEKSKFKTVATGGISVSASVVCRWWLSLTHASVGAEVMRKRRERHSKIFSHSTACVLVLGARASDALGSRLGVIQPMVVEP